MTAYVISVRRMSGNTAARAGNGQFLNIGVSHCWNIKTSGYRANSETSQIFQRGGGLIVST
jgi:hypothetical protein